MFILYIFRYFHKIKIHSQNCATEELKEILMQNLTRIEEALEELL